jgi:hypothetical protein
LLSKPQNKLRVDQTGYFETYEEDTQNYNWNFLLWFSLRCANFAHESICGDTGLPLFVICAFVRRAHGYSTCTQSVQREKGFRSSKVTCNGDLELRDVVQFYEERRYSLSLVFRRVRKIAKATVSFVKSGCPSFRPHGTSRLPLVGFSWHFRKSVEKIQVSLTL